MDSSFIKMAQQVISDRGTGVLDNIPVFNSLLADYTKGEYTRERRLLIQKLKAGNKKEALAELQNQGKPPVIQNQPIPAPNTNLSPANSNNPANNHAPNGSPGGISYLVRCPRCGNIEGITDKRDIKSRNIGHLCHACGSTWDISFFGVCRRCDEYVGFSSYGLGAAIVGVATDILNMWNEKDSTFAALRDLATAMVPVSKSAGCCPSCQEIHLECPRCGEAVYFPSHKRRDVDVVKCKNCGQKMKHG